MDPANPLLAMDNVTSLPFAVLDRRVLSQHGDDWPHQHVDALSGRCPEFVVNREVLDHPRVRAWLAA